MQRAAWKIPFISRFFFFKSFGNNCKIFTRNSTIYRKLVKKTLRVYSGKN
jgi:ribosomal protein S19